MSNMGKAFLVSVLVFLRVFSSASSLGPNLRSDASSQPISPAWAFQNTNYGKNTTGTYPFGAVEFHYISYFSGNAENYLVQIPGTSGLSYESIKESDGSYQITSENTSRAPYIITSRQRFQLRTLLALPMFIQSHSLGAQLKDIRLVIGNTGPKILTV